MCPESRSVHSRRVDSVSGWWICLGGGEFKIIHWFSLLPIQEMALERLDYFWGMYSSVPEATPEKAKGRVHLTQDEIPSAVAESFREEEIFSFSGEYGKRGVGDPEQVEELRYVHDGAERSIVVANRAIVLFKASDPTTMRQLHRFLETLKTEAASE